MWIPIKHFHHAQQKRTVWFLTTDQPLAMPSLTLIWINPYIINLPRRLPYYYHPKTRKNTWSKTLSNTGGQTVLVVKQYLLHPTPPQKLSAGWNQTNTTPGKEKNKNNLHHPVLWVPAVSCFSQEGAPSLPFSLHQRCTAKLIDLISIGTCAAFSFV